MIQTRIPRSMCFAIFAMVFAASGCIGTIAQVSRLAGGDMTPAAFDGLEDKRVAVVTVARGSSFTPDSEASMIGRAVEQLLRQHVDGVTIINQDRLLDWADQHNWNEVDPAELGKGVKADMVVVVDVASYSLTDGPTLFKGRADYSIKVLDMAEQEDQVVWSKSPPTYEFPTSGRYRDSTSRPKFERQYVTKLSQNIARHFYAYPYAEDFATDAEFLD